MHNPVEVLGEPRANDRRAHRSAISVRAATGELAVCDLAPVGARPDSTQAAVGCGTVAASGVVHVSGHESLRQRLLAHSAIRGEGLKNGERHHRVIRPTPEPRTQLSALDALGRVRGEERLPNASPRESPSRQSSARSIRVVLVADNAQPNIRPQLRTVPRLPPHQSSPHGLRRALTRAVHPDLSPQRTLRWQPIADRSPELPVSSRA